MAEKLKTEISRRRAYRFVEEVLMALSLAKLDKKKGSDKCAAILSPTTK
ncbi:hypothetical protein [Cronobacter sakazakii]|nr:hypothetical protein [Cronobacter sakazakii]MDK1285283.1 hypothetical protein [Cronobacter sakazakii]